MRFDVYLGLAACLLCAGAAGDSKYTFRENVHIGEVIYGHCEITNHAVTTTKTADNSTTSDEQDGQFVNFAATVLDAKNGSATQLRVEILPDSYDTEKTGDADETRTANAFAGKAITIRRRTDESVASDFTGNANDIDKQNLNSILNPDEDYFPEKPVAVGDSWDISSKLAKHSDLGPTDQLLAKCRLDSVKNNTAQITCSCGVIRHEDGHVEEDVQMTLVMQVDLARSMIVSCQLKGASTYSTPRTEPTQVSGGTEFTFDVSATAVSGTTQP